MHSRGEMKSEANQLPTLISYMLRRFGALTLVTGLAVIAVVIGEHTVRPASCTRHPMVTQGARSGPSTPQWPLRHGACRTRCRGTCGWLPLSCRCVSTLSFP
jgi:hypothetical protein